MTVGCTGVYCCLTVLSFLVPALPYWFSGHKRQSATACLVARLCLPALTLGRSLKASRPHSTEALVLTERASIRLCYCFMMSGNHRHQILFINSKQTQTVTLLYTSLTLEGVCFWACHMSFPKLQGRTVAGRWCHLSALAVYRFSWHKLGIR